MSRAFIQGFADAGRSIETAGQRAKPVSKACARCGCGIENRKTYCGPCYASRYEENVAANRHKYAKPKRRA